MTRHNYSPELKEKVVKEALETGNSAIVARRYNLAEPLVRSWVRTHKKGSVLNVSNSKKNTFIDTVSPEQLSEAQENERLKKIIGEKDLEIAILKDLLKKTNPQLKIK